MWLVRFGTKIQIMQINVSLYAYWIVEWSLKNRYKIRVKVKFTTLSHCMAFIPREEWWSNSQNCFFHYIRNEYSLSWLSSSQARAETNSYRLLNFVCKVTNIHVLTHIALEVYFHKNKVENSICPQRQFFFFGLLLNFLKMWLLHCATHKKLWRVPFHLNFCRRFSANDCQFQIM